MSYRVKKHSPLETRLNVIIQRIIENGLMGYSDEYGLYLIRLSTMIAKYRQYNNMTFEDDTKYFFLTMDHLKIICIYYYGCMFVAAAIFIGEHVLVKKVQMLRIINVC